MPTPNVGPEWSPVSYTPGVERASPATKPETTVERRNPERFEQRSEAASAASTMVPVLPAPVLPPPSATPVDDTASVPVIGSTPLAANDDDLIEKEWVDQAKMIIVQTKDDPYRREQEVAKLQADYLRKRYGRELGVS